jgi:hypothetical protein
MRNRCLPLELIDSLKNQKHTPVVHHLFISTTNRMFPDFNHEVVMYREYRSAYELSYGSLSAHGAEEVSKLGMILKDGQITNFHQFKLVFQAPDVRHIKVFDLNNKQIGFMFLKYDTVKVYLL